MERRYAQFIALSLAIVLAGQLLQAWLFPKPRPGDREGPAATQAAGSAAPDNAAVAAAPESNGEAAGLGRRPRRVHGHRHRL